MILLQLLDYKTMEWQTIGQFSTQRQADYRRLWYEKREPCENFRTIPASSLDTTEKPCASPAVQRTLWDMTRGVIGTGL